MLFVYHPETPAAYFQRPLLSGDINTTESVRQIYVNIQHTHTHTHTHIYIYIFGNIASAASVVYYQIYAAITPIYI